MCKVYVCTKALRQSCPGYLLKKYMYTVMVVTVPHNVNINTYRASSLRLIIEFASESKARITSFDSHEDSDFSCMYALIIISMIFNIFIFWRSQNFSLSKKKLFSLTVLLNKSFGKLLFRKLAVSNKRLIITNCRSNPKVNSMWPLDSKSRSKQLTV